MKKCIAIIPARGGSKRIPKKNIKIFKNKPIIAHVINAAKRSKCFEKIIVSTDSDNIANISKKFGAEILFKRPKKLSNDKIGTRPVINHCINFLNHLKINFEYICQIYPTGALIDYKNLIKGFGLIKTNKYNFVFGVTEYQYPIQRSLKINKNKLKMFFQKFMYKKSNKLEKIYHDAGQFYFGQKKNFLANKPMYSNSSYPIKIKKSKAWDIDDIEDWKIAEILYSKK